MRDWFRRHRGGAIGVAAALIFGGTEVLVILVDGPGAGLHSPVGLAAQALAGQWTAEPTAVRAGSDRAELVSALILGWQSLATVLFAAACWLRARPHLPDTVADRLLAMQMVLGLANASALLYVLAAELALVLPFKRALRWLGMQLLMLAAVLLVMAMARAGAGGDHEVQRVALHGSFGMLFQVLAFVMAGIARRERLARTALATANARLKATQSMLADTVRTGERMRIARDLHDAVGHHLTALNLHLDLAMRQAAGPAMPSLATSRELARSLLTEVRSVVSSEREEQGIDLRGAIQTLCAGIPEPRIRVDVPECRIESPTVALTAFFCVQEAVTNALRHAQARQLAVALTQLDDRLELTVRDDGRSSAKPVEGNGLRGMRERVTQLGGSVLAGPAATGGFQVAVVLPCMRAGT